MKRLLLCAALCGIYLLSWSQTVRAPLSNMYTRANTYSSVYNDAFSFTGNQAALAKTNKISVGIFGERRFMLEDLGTYELAFVLPTSTGNFGVKAGYFGSSSYNESQWSLAYGRRLGKIDAGVQFNYYTFKALGYGHASSVNFEAGAIIHVSDQFQTGVHIYNPIRSGIGKSHDETLPVVYSFGMGYDVSEKFFIGTAVEKTENQPVTVNTALQYSFANRLFARTGISSGTSSFYIGLGYLLDGFRIDVTASLHQSLGMSPGLLLVYNSSDKK